MTRRCWLKNTGLGLLFCCLLGGTALAQDNRVAPADLAPAGEPPATVLFAGNRFTFYNNGLHTHLRQMLLETDPARVVPDSLKAMTISGGRLADH